MSWLNNTTSDPSISPLVAEIGRLQRELDSANESIDDKLDKLEDAGLGVVGLTKKLEDARSKISRLEDEIARISRKEERYMRRFSRMRCQKCNIKVDLRKLTQLDERYVYGYGIPPGSDHSMFVVQWISHETTFQRNLLPLQLERAKRSEPTSCP